MGSRIPRKEYSLQNAECMNAGPAPTVLILNFQKEQV